MKHNPQKIKYASLYLKNGLKNFFKENKKLIIIYIIIFFVTFFTALFTAIKSASGITMFNLTDKALQLYLKGRTALGALWFSKLVNCAFYIILIYLFSYNKFLIFADMILLAYFCFVFSINACVLIIVFGISAILFSLIYFAFNLIIFIMFVFLICALNKIHCKKFYYKDNIVWWILSSIFIIFTIQILLTPIFCASIIVVS